MLDGEAKTHIVRNAQLTDVQDAKNKERVWKQLTVGTENLRGGMGTMSHMVRSGDDSEVAREVRSRGRPGLYQDTKPCRAA